MPTATVVKTLQSFVIDRATAMQIPGFRIHEYIAKRTTAVNLRVSLEPGATEDGTWVPKGLPVEIPLSTEKVGTLWPEPYNECRIVAQVTVNEDRVADPEEKLTRAQFLMQTLDAWEGLLRSIESLGVRHSSVGKEILTAMELLKDTYSFQELGTNAEIMNDLLTIHPLESIPA